MPCTYYGPGEEEGILRNELNIATRVACDACRALEAAGLPIPNDSKLWWEAHKERDRKRIEDEERQERSRIEGLYRQLRMTQEAIAVAEGKATPKPMSGRGQGKRK